MEQKFASLRDRPVLFAHRGASAHAAENTLEAFQLAIKLGATGLESDLWVTSDGVPVLNHNGYIKKALRRKTISELKKNELPEHMCTLEDLYGQCGTSFDLSLDLKNPEASGPALKVVRRHSAESRLWLCHTDLTVLRTIRSLTPAYLVHSTRLRYLKEGPERHAASLAESGIDAVNFHHSDWSAGLTTLFHRFKRYCIGWDAQYERVIRNLYLMGIDGIHSDHVDRLVSAGSG
ncbi:MAG: glycerophosphodiester phosphodiesterase [Actinobacteria bacterium]|nr:glycerophosphodiester phosphodiesterase [Actinomycetota bacterium]MDG2119939.1 glycerophosphodiester phosphodiesterase [Actinomycetota bacterium]NCG40148.1 glycerophosphodiester phosphodiesterase [Actinomycetota bacterium]